MNDGENETYHEWLARQERRRGMSGGIFLVAAWLVLAFMMISGITQCRTLTYKEPMPGVAKPLPPCLDDTDHI